MRTSLVLTAALLGAAAMIGLAQQSGPYSVTKKAKTGGPGGFDYIYADEAGRKLYVARTGNPARITVFNLDTLEPAGEVPGTNAHGAVVSAKSNKGFGSSKPIMTWDAKTLAPGKSIDVQGNPDGMLYDAFNDRVYVFSHAAPHTTVINAADGAVVGTIDLGGAPEQAASDGKGKIYVDIEDKGDIAVIDAKTLTVTGRLDLQGKGGTCAGLALDVKNSILFAACRNPQTMVMLTTDGKILGTLPIGQGTDGAAFNPNTMEAFSSNGDGTLTIIKETNPTTFAVEQTVQTMVGAKTMTLDSKTNRIILMAAEYAPPAADAPAAPKGRGGRGAPLPDSFTLVQVSK